MSRISHICACVCVVVFVNSSVALDNSAAKVFLPKLVWNQDPRPARRVNIEPEVPKELREVVDDGALYDTSALGASETPLDDIERGVIDSAESAESATLETLVGVRLGTFTTSAGVGGAAAGDSDSSSDTLDALSGASALISATHREASPCVSATRKTPLESSLSGSDTLVSRNTQRLA
jgi:hypothetical protein|tara:strand:+ start:688 stop:1224 length:537 start_codon:yes stop_codon:yes gene_type:complete